MSIKKLIIIGAVILFLLLCYLAYTLLSTTSNKPTSVAKLTVTDKNNASIEVNDFYKNAIDDSPSVATIEKQQDVATYFYNKPSNTFTITLNEGTLEEFNQKKTVAENEFLRFMGISQDEACNLKVEVVNGGSIDPELQGKTFPLSFCNK